MLVARLSLVGLMLGAALWVGDSAIDAFAFGEGTFRQQLTSPALPELSLRLFALGLVVVMSIFAQASILRRKRIEEALRETERGLRAILTNAPVVLFTTDHLGVITFSEGRGLEAAGLNASDLIGRSVFELFRDSDDVLDNIRRALDGETFTTRVDFGGATFETHYGPLHDDAGGVRGAIGVAAEITERVRAEEELQRALEAERERARRDSLTGALNHAAIIETLSEQCRASEPEPGAVLMVDLDGMKTVNDRYGHQVGDQVLIAVTKALSRDRAIVGRYGGDEFLVVLPGADRAAAERYRGVALSSVAGLGLKDPATGESIPAAASIGLAVFPQDGQTADDLIRLADRAMYTSRRVGWTKKAA
jgi:diguanylate cyclase (GGDEF)-like protein/PAS domain S-box-containing protein